MGKKLGVGEVFAILLGAIIGWGSFMLPGTQFLPQPRWLHSFLAVHGFGMHAGNHLHQQLQGG